MADAKLSELTAATSAAASDSTYLVQSATSKKITVANLFGTIATPAVFTDKIQIQGSETIAEGAISVSKNLTLIANPLANVNLTITSGIEGQVKIIVFTSNPGGYTCTLSGSSVESSITFSSAGDTATMIYTNSKWYFIGGTATIL